MLARVGVRGVGEDGGLFEGEAELPGEQDLLEPVEVLVAVTAVARRAAPARGEQSDRVAVVRGAHRDPGDPATCPTE
ncbi:hypothetical protein [Streptomyces roseofulvus]|uniref:hypothetical protein n=1 Tax=Streptomyces TaxID=1883 RepID=UPI003D2F81FA